MTCTSTCTTDRPHRIPARFSGRPLSIAPAPVSAGLPLAFWLSAAFAGMMLAFDSVTVIAAAVGATLALGALGVLAWAALARGLQRLALS